MTDTFKGAEDVDVVVVESAGLEALVDPTAPGTLDTEQTLGRRVRVSALWSGANSMLLRFANVAVAAVVARLVVPRDFGIFAIAITVNSILFNIGELGVTVCLVRSEEDPGKIAPTIATISLLAGAVLAALMAILAGPMATALGSPDAAGPIRVMSIGVLLVGVFAVPGALLIRDFRQDRQFLADLIGFAVSSGLLLVLAASGGGAMAFAWSRVGGQLVAGIVITIFVSKRYLPGWDQTQVRSLLRFGLPVAGANILNYTLLNIDFITIGRLRGAVRLGFYALAFNVSVWSSSLFSAMVNGVAMPAFSRIKHDPVRLRLAFSTTVRALASVAFPVSAISLVLAKPIITSLYGAKWGAAAPALAALAVYGAIRVLGDLFANVLVGLGRPRLLFFVQLAWLVTLTPVMVFGVSHDGIVGAGLAHVGIVAGIVLPTYIIMLRKDIAGPGGLVARAVAPPLGASVLAGSAAYLAARGMTNEALKLVFGLAAFGVVYIAAMAPWAAPLIKRLLDARGARGSQPQTMGSNSA